MRTGPPGSSGPDTGDAAGRHDRRPPRWMIFAITITGIMANTLIAPAIPDILADLGITEAGAGLLVAAATLPGVAVAPLIGLLADRYGRREVVVPCLVLFGASGGLASFAPSFSSLLALRLLQGVGSAGLINLAVVLIADHWNGVDRARLIGQNSAVLTISLAVLPPLGGLLTDVGGWRATFVPYWVGLVTALGAAAVLGPSVRQDVRIGDQVRRALGFLRSPGVGTAMGSGAVLFLLIFGLLLTVLPLYLADGFGLGPTSRGLVLGLPALTATIAALSIGRLTARFGARLLVRTGSLILTGAFILIGEAPALGLVVLGTLVYGFGEGLAVPSLQNIVAGAAPASSRGSVVAVWVGGVRLGQTAGPLLAGVAMTRIGAAGTFLAGAGIAAALLLTQVVTGQPTGHGDG